ncbi:MAG TPA: hypothetical protein VGV38_19875, partial [Pyrinomonadaceae bacterium]|nr:hypothetical protein [Pyrinomonadaceae bacterium]
IDASCLICLLHLNSSLPKPDFLQALALRYRAVYIPQYVLEEVRRKGRIRRTLNELIHRHPILEICNVTDEYGAQLLYDRHRNPNAKIQRGEAEVIMQARERRITEVLIDDKKGRKMAVKHTLVTVGTERLLVDFKRLGIVDEVKPLIKMLRRVKKLRLKDSRVKEILDEVGEA